MVVNIQYYFLSLDLISIRPISSVVIGRRSTIDLDLYMSGTV